jgi:NitT/TauT family transport system permease protein
MPKLISRLTPFVGILVFLLIWEAGVALFKPPPYLLPGPVEIFHTFVREFARLAFHGWVTLYEMLLGYALAVLVAIPLAIAITSSERFDRFSMPTLLFFQVVPKVAIAPFSGVVRRRRAAQGAGRVPDLVLSDRHRRRGGPALDVDRCATSALDGRHAHAGVRAFADQPAVPVQRPVAATLAVAGAVVGCPSAPTRPGPPPLVTNSNLETALMLPRCSP